MADTSTFVANRDQGLCCICKQLLRRGTTVRTVKLTGAYNVRGYAHANVSECIRERRTQLETSIANS